jgi:hypothetical protein
MGQILEQASANTIPNSQRSQGTDKMVEVVDKTGRGYSAVPFYYNLTHPGKLRSASLLQLYLD